MRSLESSLWGLGKRPTECKLRPVSVLEPESLQAAVSRGHLVLKPALTLTLLNLDALACLFSARSD